jgi:hypothetical protein
LLSAPTARVGRRPSFPHSVYIKIRETVNAQINREGDLEAFDLKGDMDLRINNPVYAKVSVVLGDLLPQFNVAIPAASQHQEVLSFERSKDHRFERFGQELPHWAELGCFALEIHVQGRQ